MHIFRYQMDIEIDGDKFRVSPGDMTLLQPGTLLEFRYPDRAVHMVAHFKFEGVQEEGRSYDVSAITSLGDHYLSVSRELEEVIAHRSVDELWGDLTLWNLLFRLVVLPDLAAPARRSIHPAVESLALLFQQETAEPFDTKLLTEFTGLSLTHLNRLFNEAYGMSSMQFLRHHRMQRALQLLKGSSLPISVVAQMVGVPQLQQFNRLVHREFGMSPRMLRARADDGPMTATATD